MAEEFSFDGLMERIAWLKRHEVLVGIPESAGAREGISNVALAFIHSMGSPKMHIPARPFLEPALEQADVQEQIGAQFQAAAIAALEGDFEAAEAALDAAGQYGENAAKDYIGSGHHVGNAPITIEGGWMRNPVSGLPFYVKGKGSSTPLIDTGALRASITHVIDGGEG